METLCSLDHGGKGRIWADYDSYIGAAATGCGSGGGEGEGTKES